MEIFCPCFGSSSKNKAVQASDFLKDGSFPQSDTATGVAPGKEITSIPPNSPWSGCAAKFSQPVTEDVKLAAQDLVETVYKFNCSTHEVAFPLPEIVYRHGEEDILRHVFRWDLSPYEEVFQNGFTVNRQENTPDNVYYSLDHYLRHGGRPLDSRKPATHAFISTTVDTNWHLSIDRPDISIDVYRYEIYAPGGIWVAQTLGDRYQYSGKDEVCFVAGIAPQYIRSAQCFRLSTIGTRNTKRERVDNMIRLNGNFHPQSHPSKLLDIEKPIFDFLDEKGRRVPLKPDIIQPRANSSYSDSTDWYAGKVANSRSYINAAFRSSCESESYLFMKNEYVMLNYAPGTCDDKLLIGPDFICNGFPSFAGTSFAEHGIDCAFGSHDKEEAFLFSGNLCARINYVPHTTTDKIINGPMTITAMFPFLKGTVFEEGIDAAIESTTRYQVYLFKNNQYARIHYNGSESHLIDVICPISQAFPSLKNTIFESGIDSAFASHRTGEAYLFKDDFYALFYFGSDAAYDYLIGGVKKLLLHWPSLCSVLPRQNHGLDFHDHTKHDVHRVQDEL